MIENRKIYVVLDNVRSIHNVGSIFRTADCAGAAKIYICGVTPSPFDRFGRKRPAFHKVALGAEDTVPCEYYKRTEQAIAVLKREGVKIVAVEQAANTMSFKDYIVGEDTAFVFGAEVEGISVDVLKKCDEIIEIPMRGKKESLNVSVAVGVILFRFA
jgi:tRNA G18 (ribose-2'-O)-methylase SpoU